VVVAQGRENQFRVLLVRHDCPGDVALRFEGLPQGVQADAGLGGADTEATVRLRAERDAPPGDFLVTVHAAGGTASASAPVKLTVRAVPKPPPALRLVASPE